VDVASSSLHVEPEIKSFGVIIDTNQRFDKHASTVAKACNYHIYALRRAHLLTNETARTVAYSIVGSRLDYCNAVMYGAPTMTINKLQRVQNNLVGAVCRCSGRTDARPLLKSLHWLPIHELITYKVAELTYKIRTSSTPSYLSDLLHPVTSSCSSRSVDTTTNSTDSYRTRQARFLCRSTNSVELTVAVLCWLFVSFLCRFVLTL